MANKRTFSDSWYVVAKVEVALRPTVTIRKQIFRGETWYLVHDPFNNSFFRVRPEGYHFIARLRVGRTVEAVWEECLRKYPDSAPGQEDAIALLAQLHQNNLLYYPGSTDSSKVFERYERRKQAEMRARLVNILFPSFHVFDPDPLLNRFSLLIRLIVSRGAFLVWLLVVAYGISTAIEHPEDLRSEAQGILAPHNWLPLYVAIILLKLLHELGHALICKRLGGDVHSMGVGLVMFTPLPFVDATSAWGFRDRVDRLLVGLGGMIVELFMAAVAVVVWVNTAPGTLHGVAYNMMWIASISTLVFNLNPLVRFDGYYIMVDLLDLPNLHQRSKDQLVYLIESWVYGIPDLVGPAFSDREAIWLTAYGIVSGLYRFSLIAAVISFVADSFLLVGLIMAFTAIFTWIVIPLWSISKYLASDKRLARTRARAITITAVTVGSLFATLAFLPLPTRSRAVGIVEALEMMEVTCDAPGRLERVVAVSGTRVTTGTPLIELSDPELEFEIRAAAAEIEEVRAVQQQSEWYAAGDRQMVARRMEVAVSGMKLLEAQKEALTVRARHSGLWFAPGLVQFQGSHVGRGTMLGKIVNDSAFRFSAVVRQEEASDLFLNRVHRVQVRLAGKEEVDVPVAAFYTIPYEQKRLPSVALGWRGGGDVAVSMADQTGLESSEPFFELRAILLPFPGISCLQGRSGTIRLTLDSEPLLRLWIRRLRQMVQRRYQV